MVSEQKSSQVVNTDDLDDDILDLFDVVEIGKGVDEGASGNLEADFVANLDSMLDDLESQESEDTPFPDPTPVDHEVDPNESLDLPSMDDLDNLLAELGAEVGGTAAKKSDMQADGDDLDSGETTAMDEDSDNKASITAALDEALANFDESDDLEEPGAFDASASFDEAGERDGVGGFDDSDASDGPHIPDIQDIQDTQDASDAFATDEKAGEADIFNDVFDAAVAKAKSLEGDNGLDSAVQPVDLAADLTADLGTEKTDAIDYSDAIIAGPDDIFLDVLDPDDDADEVKIGGYGGETDALTIHTLPDDVVSNEFEGDGLAPNATELVDAGTPSDSAEAAGVEREDLPLDIEGLATLTSSSEEPEKPVELEELEKPAELEEVEELATEAIAEPTHEPDSEQVASATVAVADTRIDEDLNELDALLDDMLSAPSIPAASTFEAQGQQGHGANLPMSDELHDILERLDNLEEATAVQQLFERCSGLEDSIAHKEETIETLEQTLTAQQERIAALEEVVEEQQANLQAFSADMEKMVAAAAAKVIREEIAALIHSLQDGE